MAITIKKKKLELKSDAPEPVEGTGDQPAEETDSVIAAMPISVAAPRKSGGSFVPFVICGLLACALLGTLVAIQVIENSFYTGAIPQHGAVANR